MKRWLSGAILLVMLLAVGRAWADPLLSIQDTAVHTDPWGDAYTRILENCFAGIEAYQDYVTSVTDIPLCHPVDLRDLTGDGIPELLFLELIPENEYGFKVGRLWIYTSDGNQVFCAMTLQPEIDDLLYSTFFLAEDGVLTLHFSDTERSWTMQLRPDKGGHYAAETILTEEADFSGEGPDYYFRNGKKISLKEYKKLATQIKAKQGTLIGSLMIDDGGCGMSYTLEEALSMLSSGTASGTKKTQTSLEQPSEPSESRFPELTFFRGNFEKGQKFAVYSAPSTRAYRGARGKASITSGSEIFVAGTVDDWILILYELDSGVSRVGYIDSKKIKGSYTAGDTLLLTRTQMKLTEPVVMTDDPVNRTSTIGKLKKGTSVICLAEYRGWIYVEAKVSGKTARGFIPASSLGN